VQPIVQLDQPGGRIVDQLERPAHDRPGSRSVRGEEGERGERRAGGVGPPCAAGQQQRGQRPSVGRGEGARRYQPEQIEEGRCEVDQRGVGIEQARGELVSFADSDIRPDREALRALVRTLLCAPDFGAAFAPVVVALPPKTVGDAGYALLLNGLYSPAFNYVAHHNHGSMPFIMGQMMVFRREAIRAIGGIESAEGQLVDDMYLGERVARAGYRNVVSPHAVPIIQQNLGLGDFLSTYVRWLTFSRSGLPGLAFKVISWLRGIVFWAGFVLTLVAMAESSWLLAALAALAPILTSASINLLYQRQTGVALPLRYAWVGFALLMTAPIVMATILLHREIDWRGRRYSLDPASRLAARPVGSEPPMVPAGR
jgi:ceramide glucosyltransferase